LNILLSLAEGLAAAVVALGPAAAAQAVI